MLDQKVKNTMRQKANIIITRHSTDHISYINLRILKKFRKKNIFKIWFVQAKQSLQIPNKNKRSQIAWQNVEFGGFKKINKNLKT